MSKLYESDLEAECLRWFADLDYEVLESHNVEPDGVYEERREPTDVILEGRLRAALDRLNPEAPPEAIEEAIRRLRRHDAPTLEQNNGDFHSLITDGVTVEVSAGRGRIQGVRVRIVAFEDPELNDWVVARQISVVDRVTGTGRPRTPDVVVWVNGLPLAVIELKNPTSEQADIWQAYDDLQIYKRDIPSLFNTNAFLIVSDDTLSRIGSLTSDRARFQPWRAVENEKDLRVPAEDDRVLDRGERLQTLIEGVFQKDRFLDFVRHFTTFERSESGLIKKIAAYHQFHAVREAIAQTVRATTVQGDRRIGVVWHTQGSGKSLTMLFYAGKLVTEPTMENPTIVVITDRNDLDDQLFGVFAEGEALLRQKPIQARDREHLRELLRTASGGVYFTTIQKFLPAEGERQPCLTERRNVVVIADEAHRSQYGLKARFDTKRGRIDYGFAKHMRDTVPNASFIGFTGTPVKLDDKNTVKVFGDYISVYDIRRAVEDHATVPIYYENRLAKLELDERERPKIDPDFEEATEGEDAEEKERLKTNWSTLEALVGTRKRLALVAADLVDHFEKRNQAMNGGKAMVVCMSRRICAELYKQITKLRPAWNATDDDDGEIKVVFTGSETKDSLLEPHLRSKARQRRIADRFKNPNDKLKLVLVRDMWLTGFDAPCLHTLYIDKPMGGHNLMQAIARVNRVFGDKPGGLAVDYIGIASFLKDAMKTYTQSGGHGEATIDYARALGVFEGKLELCSGVLQGL